MFRTISRSIPLNGAQFKVEGNQCTVTGKYGALHIDMLDYIKVSPNQEGQLSIELDKLSLNNGQKARVGCFKALLMSSIKGVQEMHSRVVIFTGTGSSVKVVGQTLQMRIGKSHIVEKIIVPGIECKVESADIRETRLRVSGIDAAKVGQFAAELCTVKNPYKGGIHIFIDGHQIPLREGKRG